MNRTRTGGFPIGASDRRVGSTECLPIPLRLLLAAQPKRVAPVEHKDRNTPGGWHLI